MAGSGCLHSPGCGWLVQAALTTRPTGWCDPVCGFDEPRWVGGLTGRQISSMHHYISDPLGRLSMYPQQLRRMAATEGVPRAKG